MTAQVRSQKYPASAFAFLNTSNADMMLYYNGAASKCECEILRGIAVILLGSANREIFALQPTR